MSNVNIEMEDSQAVIYIVEEHGDLGRQRRVENELLRSFETTEDIWSRMQLAAMS